MKRHILPIVLGLFAAAQVQSAIVQFDLTGVAGNGMLAGNEPTYDTATSNLTIHVGWGSANGFIDLSSAANNSHVHGPTTTNYGNGYTQTAGVMFNLTRTSNLATGGTISNTVALTTASQIAGLFSGKLYINIHTLSLFRRSA
jgi:hypothetical protein